MTMDSRRVRLSVAAVAALAAAGARLALDSAAGPASWYLCFIPFVVFSAWYGGLKPGLITTALLAAYAWYMPAPAPAADAAVEPVRLGLFIFSASFISWAMQSLRLERFKSQIAESRVRTVLESTNDIIFSVDPELRITYANQAGARLARKHPDELKGRSLRTVFPETPTVILYRELTHALLESVHVQFEDGNEQSHRWFTFNIYPVPSGLNLFVTDITADKKMQIDRARMVHEVKHEHTKVEAVLQQLPVGVVIVNSALRLEMANPAAKDLFGKPLARGDRFDDRLADPADSPIAMAARTGVAVSNFEFESVNPAGEPVTLLVNCLPVHGRQGETTGVIATYSDVTSLRHMERRLSVSEARLRRLLESPVIGIVAGSGEAIREANEAFLAMVGYSSEELLHGLTWTSITPPEFEGVDRRALQQMADSGFSEPFEKDYIRKDGQRVSVLLAVAACESGEDASWIAWALDVSEHRRLEVRLRESARLESIGLLAGGVAHDFNNILTGVLGHASIALEMVRPEHAAREAIENTINSAERAADLTRQLLAYAGKGSLVVGPVDVSRLLRDTGRLIRSSVPRSVELDFDLAPGLPSVEADGVQLQQLVMNLVINATEALGEKGGTVRICARDTELDVAAIHSAGLGLAPGRYVSLEVQDTGCGMDEATLKSIFDPFFTTKFAGRGLGLAAALGIARGHKGAIKVYTAQGAGSTFHVLLPAMPPQLNAAVSEDLAEAPAPCGTGTILVVDDEEMLRDVAKAVLEKYGYTVLVAVNGRQALEIYRGLSHSIGMVMLDMTMPQMSGEEALLNLRALNPEVKVLLTSGFNEPETLQRVMGDVCGFIQKPYSAEALARRVYQVMQQ